MKKLTININEVSGRILQDLLVYQKLQLVIAQKKDIFKNNDYLIKVCDEVISQIENELEKGN